MLQRAAVCSEFERPLSVERTRAGRAVAKRRGAKVGRKPVLTRSQIIHARSLVQSGESPTRVALTLKVGRTTLYRALKQLEGAA